MAIYQAPINICNKCAYDHLSEEAFLLQSEKDFNAIFESVGIESSEIIQEGAIGNFISKIKEWFKKVFAKFMEWFRNTFKKTKVIELTLNKYHAEHIQEISRAYQVIKNGIVEETPEFYLFYDMIIAQDHPIFSQPSLAVHWFDDENLEKLKKMYNDDKRKKLVMLIDGINFKNAVSKSAQRNFASRLSRMSDDEIDNFQIPEFTNFIKQTVRGPKTSITKDNLNIMYVNLQYLATNNWANTANKISQDAKKSYDEGIKRLEEAEKQGKSEDVDDEKIQKCIQVYASYVKFIYNANCQFANAYIATIDAAIVEYLKIAKYLVSIADKYNESKNTVKESANIFSNLQMI